MNFLEDISNKKISLSELEKGLHVIRGRFDSLLNGKNQVQQAHYLKVKNELSNLFAI